MHPLLQIPLVAAHTIASRIFHAARRRQHEYEIRRWMKRHMT